MLYRETLTAGLALDGQLAVFTLTLGTEVACTTEPLAVFTVQVTVRKKEKKYKHFTSTRTPYLRCL